MWFVGEWMRGILLSYQTSIIRCWFMDFTFQRCALFFCFFLVKLISGVRNNFEFIISLFLSLSAKRYHFTSLCFFSLFSLIYLLLIRSHWMASNAFPILIFRNYRRWYRQYHPFDVQQNHPAELSPNSLHDACKHLCTKFAIYFKDIIFCVLEHS